MIIYTRLKLGADKVRTGNHNKLITSKYFYYSTNVQTTAPAVSAVYPNGVGSKAFVFPSIRTLAVAIPGPTRSINATSLHTPSHPSIPTTFPVSHNSGSSPRSIQCRILLVISDHDGQLVPVMIDFSCENPTVAQDWGATTDRFSHLWPLIPTPTNACRSPSYNISDIAGQPDFRG